MKKIVKIVIGLCFLSLSVKAYTHIKVKAKAKQSFTVSTLNLGGESSVVVRGPNAFSLPAKNASNKHRRSFVIGNSLFKENWVATPASVMTRQGLGPLINAQSCSSCHFKDGRGQPPSSPNEPFNSMLVRLSIPGHDENGGPKGVSQYGDQFNHRAIVGVRPEGDVKVHYTETSALYPDGMKYSLLTPEYIFENLSFGDLPKDVMISPRVAPAIIGLGLLEAIPEKDILALADAEDKNIDGISGRPNWVWDVENKRKKLGRFGWKANQPSVAQQNAGAFLGDMGITSQYFPQQNCSPKAQDCLKAPALKEVEISESNMQHMNAYVKLLAVPQRRAQKDPLVQAGHKLFLQAKCISCHVENFQTGVDPLFPENSQQVIHPFTDLLVHDMGEGLADHRPDFEASGTEWRTPPLWGIGLVKEVNGHTRFLHDGRARNLEEAILWHGGEAEASKKNFMQFKKEDREALIRFLESL